ncbi:MAG: hypothetical protein JRJ84_12695 [Deltaproteobacteria bacterium]|nr:hypothetical protein [Deltaproteobacteria bacterium]
MDSIVGMTPTGRRISGPSADLVEVESDKGLKHTAIVYPDEFVEHPTLLGDLKEFGKFMEKPGITGLVELVARDDAEGAYVYPTGTVWSVAEVVRVYNDLGEACGIRAGLEIAYVASQILIEAEESAARYELFVARHGQVRRPGADHRIWLSTSRDHGLPGGRDPPAQGGLLPLRATGAVGGRG